MKSLVPWKPHNLEIYPFLQLDFSSLKVKATGSKDFWL